MNYTLEEFKQKVADYYKWVKDEEMFTHFIPGDGGYEFKAELDFSKWLYAVSVGLYNFTSRFLQANLLSKEAGYLQSDGTRAIYPYKLEAMQKIVNSEFEDMTREEQEYFVNLARPITACLVEHLVENFENPK